MSTILAVYVILAGGVHFFESTYADRTSCLRAATFMNTTLVGTEILVREGDYLIPVTFSYAECGDNI